MRLATEAAKRNALEQVATYLESMTVVEGVDVTRDEITTYTQDWLWFTINRQPCRSTVTPSSSPLI
jgi:hypothetical protein